MDVPNHKGSSTIEGEVKSQKRKDTSKEISENKALKDDKSATNEAEAGQSKIVSGSSRHKEDAGNQIKELLEKGEALKEDIPKVMSKDKALKDDNSATNEAEAGQSNKKTDSSRHKEDAEAPHKEHKKEKPNSSKEEPEDKCSCIRYFEYEDLGMKSSNTMLKHININIVPYDPIYHTLKWLGDIHRNRGRICRKYLDGLWKEEEPSDLKGKNGSGC